MSREADGLHSCRGSSLGLVWWTVFTLVGYIVATMIQPSESPAPAGPAGQTDRVRSGPRCALGTWIHSKIRVSQSSTPWWSGSLWPQRTAFQHVLGDRSSQGVLKSIGITVAGLLVWVMIQVVFRPVAQPRRRDLF